MTYCGIQTEIALNLDNGIVPYAPARFTGYFSWQAGAMARLVNSRFLRKNFSLKISPSVPDIITGSNFTGFPRYLMLRPFSPLSPR